METLLELAGRPDKCAPSIHIAGSKGKGSVTAMTASILKAAGFRAGRYMSPHVIDIRERVCLGDSYFDEEIYRKAGSELRCLMEEKLPASVKSNPGSASLFDKNSPGGCEPTYWELLTLLFFLCAREANCDAMVVETGMGGRLDSTNVLDPLVSVITLIELEHTAFLGNTIAAVAGEKAGIIKKDKPLILAEQCEEALNVFKEKANEKNSLLFYLPETAEISDIKITAQGANFTLSFKKSLNYQLSIINSPFFIPIPGKVQAYNAALAIAAAAAAFPQIKEKAIHEGLANLKIPARFEKIALSCEMPPFIIDGAHTPQSLEQCIETFCSLYGEGGVLLFGCAADKDMAAMAKIAAPRFAKIIITAPGTFKTSDPARVYENFLIQAGQAKTELIRDTKTAVFRARDYSIDNNLPALGTGSFYLVSEIRKHIG
ncbi:MAG: tetrahydrofolate synthase [Treponema sp.]|jgi:dihydrofolate synthase/folylpolyglutamate synthase|nr:tetrahydrofolate synthase [Treponema sp.]